MPKYKAQANTAYRKENATFIYYNFGNGDSCGRVPDTFGEETAVKGAEPHDGCLFTEADRLAAKEPLICATKPKPSHVATSVPINDARELAKSKDPVGF